MRSPFRSASLHTKLMLAIGLLVALVAGIAGWVVVDHERQRRMVELENRATRIADLYSQSLAQALWNVDRASIDRLLLAQSPNPELAQLKVTAANYGTVSELLKLPGDLTLDEAHAVAENVEQSILDAVPEATTVRPPLEPIPEPTEGWRPSCWQVDEHA